jgi:transcriptional regulator
MYTPPAYKMTDTDAVYGLIRAYDFAVLVVPGEDDMLATHLPLKLDEDKAVLTGHAARANPFCKAVEDGQDVLAVFSGPHAYVSPTWYSDPDNNVPTWNYLAVHVYGKLRALSGDEAGQALSAQVADFESSWRITNLEEKKRAKMEAAILPFELIIERIEAKAKLSQNKPIEERVRLADALNERGESAIAYHMVETREDE